MESAMEKVWESGRRMSRSIGRGMGMEAWGVDDVFMPQQWGSRGAGSRRSGRRVDDDEEALRWAAIERLPTYSRVRTAILSSSAEAEAEADGAGAGEAKPRQQYKEVDVRKLGVGERQEFIERVFRVAEEDNQRFLQKLRNRIDRVGIELPTVEVRFEHLTVQAKCHIGSRALPTLLNTARNIAEGALGLVGIRLGRQATLTILKDVSGVVRPSRMTLLLGPPSSGKTSLLLALAGKLDPTLKCTGAGTSACPEGKFYCKNAGHTPIMIFSSRVNDGICDCCDGSDEYGSNVTCKNTCWEAGKVAREKLKKKVATYKSGVIIRKQEVERAKEAFSKDEAELAKLKGEEKLLQGLVDKLKEQKRLIEKAEEEERLRKEKEEKRIKEEAEKKAADEKKTTDASQEVDFKETDVHVQEDEPKVAEQHDGHALEHDNHVPESGSSVEQHDSESQDDNSIEAGKIDESLTKESAAAAPTKEQDPSSDNPEGLSREELGRLVASRWTGENVNEVSKDDKKGPEDEHEIPEPAEEALEDELEIPKPAEENYGGYHSEVEDDRHKYDDEEFDSESEDEYVNDHDEHVESYKSDDDQKGDHHSDITAAGQSSWLDKIQQTVQTVFQKFNFFKTPVDLSEASHVRKEYADASSKLSKIQSKISTLTEKLKHDFGKEKEFYYFYDQCFESKDGKYLYKVCPYKKASQSEGHSSTNLGRWDKFEESYRVMQFANGDRCWNGPDRSLKVRLRCGLSNEVNDVDEPSRCEYVAVLSTPALCIEEKLKELQQKLDAMSSNQPGHDEL